MSERLNKTSICSVIFLDIVNQSKKPVAEQIKDKDLFNGFINEAIKDVAQNDRILLDTGDGAAIALLGAPEEALFITLTIRDNIVKYNKDARQKLLVRFGINLGPVRVVTDINGRPNILGDGINVAERVMSFAEPNQILVSRSYYEITSRLTEEITNMFSYFGLRQDKHVREHEVYAIRSAEEIPFVPEAPEAPEKDSLLSGLFNNENPSRYGAWGTGALVLLTLGVGGYLLASKMLGPDLGHVVATTAPAATTSTPLPAMPGPSPVTQPVERKAHVAAPNLIDPASPNSDTATMEQLATTTSASADSTTATPNRRTSRSKTTVKPEGQVADSLETEDESAQFKDSRTMAAAPAENRATQGGAIAPPDIKAGWEAFKKSLKQGRKERSCTQAEISLNQCRD